MDMIAAMESFVYDGEQVTLGSRWSRWLGSFENFLIAFDITDDDRKVAMLLHLGGKRIRQIYRNSDVTVTPRVADPTNNIESETRFDAVKRVLNNYFNKYNNVTYNRYVFRSAKQAANETLNQFYLRLCELAEGCDFHDEKEEVKCQIIFTCISKKLRAEAITKEWDLETLLERGNAYEQAKFQAKQIEDGLAKFRAELNKKGRRINNH